MKYGDIITYIDENENFITHRIVDENEKKLITKGDNNNQEDSEISKDRILGKVIVHSSILGKIIKNYLSYIFIIVTIIVAFVNLCFYFKKGNSEEEKND